MEEFIPIKNEKTIISIRLSVDLLNKIDEIAADTDLSRNEIIVQGLEYSVKNFKKN